MTKEEKALAAIVQFVIDNPGHISEQFVNDDDDDDNPLKNGDVLGTHPLTEEPLTEATAVDPNNWRCCDRGFGNDDDLWLSFHCVPFDDQLRAYVEFDSNDNVINVEVHGE